VFVIALTTSLPKPGFAQERPAEVQASALLVAQPATTPYPRISPPLSGQTLAGALGVSRFITPRTAVEAEIVLGGSIRNPQRFVYSWSVDYVAESRDTLFNLLTRWHPTRSRAFAIVAGGGMARTTVRSHSRIRTDAFLPGRPTTREADQQIHGWDVTLTGGVDVLVPLTARVALAPTARVRWIRRPSQDGLSRQLGHSRYAFHLGTGIRLAF
jgi:hypothetical protein